MSENPVGFAVDTDRLNARATEFPDLAGRAACIANELARSLAGAERAWGDDLVGLSFAAAHAGLSAETLRQIHGLSDGLTSVGNSLTEAARRYQASDQRAAQEIDRAASRA